MNYNIVVIISVVISAVLAMLLSYYGTLFMLDEKSGLFKISQLVIAIVSMMTFYAPIKYMLLKYMEIELEEDER